MLFKLATITAALAAVAAAAPTYGTDTKVHTSTDVDVETEAGSWKPVCYGKFHGKKWIPESYCSVKFEYDESYEGLTCFGWGCKCKSAKYDYHASYRFQEQCHIAGGYYWEV